MKNRKRALKITISSLILLFAVYFLFTPEGIVQAYFYLDLSFLTRPFMILIVLLLPSRLINAFTEQNWAKGVRIALDGLALIFFAYTFFEASSPILSNHRSLTAFTVLAIIGISVIRAKDLARFEGFKHVISGAAVLLIGYALWEVSLHFSKGLGSLPLSLDQLALGPLKIWEGNLNTQLGLADFRNAFFAGLIVIAVALFLSCGVKSKNSIIKEVSNWLYKSQLRNFLIGFLFCFYLLTLRPILSVIFPPIQLFEWGIAGFIVARTYSGFKSEIDKRYTVLPRKSPWTKHVQRVTYRKDEDFEAVKELQEHFVEKGVKAPLTLYLTQLLSKNGFSIEHMSQILGSIIYYEDEKIPLIAFGWEKKRIIKKNRKKREEVLKDLMETLSSLQPVRN